MSHLTYGNQQEQPVAVSTSYAYTPLRYTDTAVHCEPRPGGNDWTSQFLRSGYEIPGNAVSRPEVSDRQAPTTENRPKGTISLSNYDGTTSLDVFLTRFRICRQHNNWSESDSWNHLMCALQNNAAAILTEWDACELSTVDKLIGRLEQRFGTSSRTNYYQAQLQQRTQAEGESLEDLAASIRQLTSLAYRGISSSHSDL